jgi:hypothetical protein
LSLLRRHGINASQFVAKAKPAANKPAPMTIKMLKSGKGKQNVVENKAESAVWRPVE